MKTVHQNDREIADPDENLPTDPPTALTTASSSNLPTDLPVVLTAASSSSLLTNQPAVSTVTLSASHLSKNLHLEHYLNKTIRNFNYSA